MSKKDTMQRMDASPATHNGEIVTGATVVQVSQLAISGPYRGDFQVVENGRVIVGEHPDIGQRVIVSQTGIFGYNAANTQTFGVWTRSDQAGHTGGDVWIGHPNNHLFYDQSEGRLTIGNETGDGFIATSSGDLWAGRTDGAHMHWNQATGALQLRNGEVVRVEIDAAGNAFFDGVVQAAGGRIYGTMQVDALLRAGHVDGPSVTLGRFVTDADSESGAVESAEIIAYDARNLPWFHVVAGGGTSGGGWFQLGGVGEYPNRLVYNGETLVFDGILHARGGEFTGSVTLGPAGELLFGDGNALTADGAVFNAATGKFSSAVIRWTASDVDYFRVGVQTDLGVPQQGFVASLLPVSLGSEDALYFDAPAITLDAQYLSFFGKVPSVTRPVVPVGSSTNDVITALHALGLFGAA